MCNLINIHTYIHTYIHNGGEGERRSAGRERGRERGRDGAGTGTGTGVETLRRTPDGNGDGNGSKASTVAEMGTGTMITETRTRIGSGRAEKRRKSARNRKIVVDAVRETEETWVEREKKCRKERVGSVAANPDNLESNKKAGGGARGTQGSSKNCTGRESVFPLSPVIRGFRNKYH